MTGIRADGYVYGGLAHAEAGVVIVGQSSVIKVISGGQDDNGVCLNHVGVAGRILDKADIGTILGTP
jgi:hypothetical protein